MSARRILRAFDRQPAGRFEIDQRVLPGRSQVFLPSLGYSGVLYGGSCGSPIVTLQNANAPFTQESVRGGRAHVYRPNTGTIAGESYKWQTPDFDIGSNGSMFYYGYRDTDGYPISLEYGGANWGLLLENTGTQVKASYVDNPTTAEYVATLSQTTAAKEIIAIGLIKQGTTVTVVCRGSSASASGGNGGIRRSAGSGFGVEYNANSYSGVFLAGVTSEALSVSAMQALLDTPWSVFRAHSRRIFIPSAGGGGATDIAGALESIALSTFGATVGSARDIAGALESLSLTPYAATVGSARAITAAVESISLGTYAATVSRDTAIAGGLESIALTANAASVTLGAAIAAALEAIVLATNPAAVALDAAIAAQLEQITITGLGATVSTSSDVNIGAALESITLSVPQALVSSDRDIAGGLESIQITAHGATVTLGALIQAALEQISVQSLGAGITLNVTLAGGLEQINLTTLAAQIGLGSNVAALVEAITLTEFGATLTMTGEIAAALESIGLTTFVATVVGGESALTTPGLEFTIPVGRMHYAIPIGRIHFTIPRD